MKLFLSSQAISEAQSLYFLKLTDKNKAGDVKLVLIENAADCYPEDKKQFVYDNRAKMQACGFQIDLLDLQQFKQDQTLLLPRLEHADVIWLGGGNTYYLRWILRETKADVMIKDLVSRGKIYGGGSAGAIVAGPTLHYYETADRPDDAPEVIYDGLHLTDIAVLPHWDHIKYGAIMPSIKSALEADGYKSAQISDDQALIVDDGTYKIIP